MTDGEDRIVLTAMGFDAHVGVSDDERSVRQPIELDVEMTLDLGEAGRTDDLGATVDYGAVFRLCRDLVELGEFRLLEAVAERVAAEVLATTPAGAVLVRVRKLHVPVDGRIEHAGVQIARRRSGARG